MDGGLRRDHTSFLAFVHFGTTRSNPAMALIAPIFLFAGILDAIHALASIDLLQAAVATTAIIPLTWAVGRFYVAIGLAVSPIFVGVQFGRAFDRIPCRPALAIEAVRA